MTARELRQHLNTDHRIPNRGLMWAELVDLHDSAHRGITDHRHDGR